MPQFDPSSFASQLFWLILCFSVLYVFLNKIYLPKIKSIIKERAWMIDRNKLLAEEITTKITEISDNTSILKNNALTQYQLAIEQSMKQASLDREKELNNLRKNIAHMVTDCDHRIARLIQISKDDCDIASKKLVNLLSGKLLG